MLLYTIRTLFIDSWFSTAYAFLCSIILCLLYQIFILRKSARKENVRLTGKHFVGVYIFLFYLTCVYLMTGAGTIWDFSYYGGSVYLEEIFLIPFETFDSAEWQSNLISYLLNIIMTIPLGFLLPLLWPEFRSLKKVALTGFIFAFAIELSQILNRRATTTDDLIMNTLGTIVGFVIFRFLFKLISKDEIFKPKFKATSVAIKDEAIIYLACSFIGLFFLFNSLFYPSILAPNDGYVSGEMATNTNEYIIGNVLETGDDFIMIDFVETWSDELSDYSSNTGKEVKVNTDENTVFELRQSDNAGTLEPVVSQVSKDDLKPKDLIYIYFIDGYVDSLAEKIVIFRFDL